METDTETDTGTGTETGSGSTTEPGADADPPTGAEATAGIDRDEIVLVPDAPSEIDAVEALLDQVDRALVRLDDGSYGRCESCGAIIADDRLSELPATCTCAGCPTPVAG